MGRKHIRARKHICLCIAGLILFSFSGCATLKDIEKRQAARKNLFHSRELLTEGNFNEALRENRKILSLFVKSPPGDEALFNIALIYAHYDNPEKDYKKSIAYFTRLIEEYPQSPEAEQAKIWVNVLRVIEKPKAKKVKIVERKTTNKNLIRSQKLLARGNYKGALKENMKVLDLPESSFRDEAFFNIALIYAHYDNPEKDYKKSLFYLSRLIKDYPESTLTEQARIWLDVLNVIEKSKQVDIEIEKKKKELTR
ncbi:MAG TPA: tetratricopeptide repeat protein [Nitrospirae bacterium]|nr:outer membrane biogenesis protein BamD [bacterium BMS3Abin06]HDH12760.1 tetratricopeptide repeat protein [Nitrospirota bacterium]HDZ00069.1 tetratricopeptide repeat protein [Nitrospirota bacterium]